MILLGFIGPQEIIIIALLMFVSGIVLLALLGARQRISCIKCDHLTKRGGFRAIQYVVSVIFFPLGLLSLIAGRNPTVCEKCGHTWIA